MIDLPSTTRVNKRLSKEAFYRHLKLTAQQKYEFIHGIESITVANSLKTSTLNVKAGELVQEILVLTLELKEQELPLQALNAIAVANPHKILFCCSAEDTYAYALARSNKLWHTEWLNSQSFESPTFTASGNNLDQVWDCFCGSVIFNNNKIQDIDRAILAKQQIEQLDAKIAKLERLHRKESQPARRNMLYKVLKDTRTERMQLLEEL